MTLYDLLKKIKPMTDFKNKSSRGLLLDLLIFWDEGYKSRTPDGWFPMTDKQTGEPWDKKTFSSARKELIEKGYIEYRRGRTGKPSQYRFKV